MPEAGKGVKIVGQIGLYDPKSMVWSTYKIRFTFDFQANTIGEAALKRATLLTHRSQRIPYSRRFSSS